MAGRDSVIDLVRSGATTTVVVYHWVFTIIVWRPDGPHADNPIGYVSGLWFLTWILQVLPLFFMAGGFTHSLAWAKYRETPKAWWRFVARRAGQLLGPAVLLVGVVVGAALTVASLRAGSDSWFARGVILVLSPLWFLVVYLVLVATVPLWDRLHRRFGELVPLGLAALAMSVDVLRFRYDVGWIAFANLVFVWAACHQVGWSWDRLSAAPKRFGHALILIGFAALAGLTNMGLYPRSMVGTTSPLDRFSNMGPPTLPIIALLTLQLGLVVANRDRLAAWAERPRIARRVAWMSRNAMPLFLWHSVGFAAFFIAMRSWTTVPESPTLVWWLTRPLWLIGPALATLPLVAASTRLLRPSGAVTGARKRTAVPA
ncbi:MAG TPA: acyltransferase [Actinomycetota bacterium]|nr:acyltransferase [Actinomycetota bacterium]